MLNIIIKIMEIIGDIVIVIIITIGIGIILVMIKKWTTTNNNYKNRMKLHHMYGFTIWE